MPYTQKAKAAYYDCDASSRMRISAVVRYLQQVATDHLDVIDLSYEQLYAENMVFLLAKTSLVVEKMPVAGEEFTLLTAPVATKGARFIRDIAIDDLEGNRMVSAVTTWMLVNPKTRRILRPKSFKYQLPYEESISSEYVEEKGFPHTTLVVPDYTMSYPVLYSHIDNNGHVNNSYYLDFACNILPDHVTEDLEIHSVEIQYQNEALLGNEITLKGYDYGNKVYYVEGTVNEEPCFQALLTLK